MPAFVTNAEALAHETDVTILCLSHGGVGDDRRAPADGVVVDLSGAHRLRDAAGYSAWYGFEHPHPERPRRLGLRAARARRGDRPPDREPRLLRDRDAARARADRGTRSTRTPSSSTASRA